MEGIVFDIQRFSVHDGPGIRTIVFLKGCPLRCLWCDNPESQRMHPEIAFIKEKCIKCGTCFKVCPQGAIIETREERIDRTICNNCGKCAETCSAKALVLIGKTLNVREVLSEVTRDIPFYRRSGGGITLSGGEPLMQAEFSRELLKTSKEEHLLNTAIETCGYSSWRNLKSVLEYTDLVLYDIKMMDPLKHKELTGVFNHLILDNARRIVQHGVPMIVRIPLIPGYNDNVDNIRETGEFVRDLEINEIHLLPFHQLGKHKYDRLNMKYVLKDLQSANQSQVKKPKQILESYRLYVHIGG